MFDRHGCEVRAKQQLLIQGIGAALAGYGAHEARAIAGLQSDAIAKVLGYPGRAAMIHADDMVIWDK